MLCPGCRHENPPQAKFCLECGARLALKCSRCGAELPATAKFCLECGQPVGSAPTAPGRFASPETYTPRHLAEKILTSKTAIEGERKEVTVLFADLKGSMEALDGSDPEEARDLLDPVVDRMMEAVHRYEGTVCLVMGDGIMALFGAPLSLEDHAVRACYAALRMQETLGRYAEEIHRSKGIPLQIRVGLNSGEVVVRSISNDLRMEYTALGQTTHLAARMEQMALPGTILIAPETLRLAEDFVVVKALGPRPVKGLEAPVEVYELTGAETVRSRICASAARGLTRFVGRDSELEQLRQALEFARGGRGQVVAVVGEPGVGKSRLYWEFTHSHRTQGSMIIEAGSVSYGKATAYLPVIELLRSYFQIQARDEARRIREMVTGRVLSLDRSLESSLPAYLALLDVPTEDAQWERLDPAHRRQRTIEAVKRLLLRESQVQPLIVMFEDLHWIDAETQALLDSLVESLPTSRLLLLLNYRPEYRHGWGGKTYYRQIRIDPLAPESAEELLDSMLGNDPSLPDLKRLLIERTEGNPFFLEESVRTLVETHALVGTRGAFRLEKPVQSLGIPASARAILTARIDRLAAEDKRLLQAASVIGKDVPFTLLEAIAEIADDSLRQGLSHLQAGEFLYEARLFPDVEYTFKHALTHDVSYQSLVHDRRCELHRRIVDAIERVAPDRVAEHLERLAHHAFHGEAWEKAVAYSRQAGLKAFARSANREAVAYYEQALVALGHVPASVAVTEQAIDLRFDLRASLFQLMDLDKSLAYIREAEQLARSIDDRHRLARVSVYTSHHLLVSGDAEEACRFAQSARAIADTLDDVAMQVVSTLYCGATCIPVGEFRLARTHLERALALVPGDLRRQRFGLHGYPVALVGHYLPWALAETGDFTTAIAHAKDAVALAEEVEHAYSIAVAHWGLAYAYVQRGDHADATRLLEQTTTLCRDWTIPILLQISTGLLGIALTRSGRIEEGIGAVTAARHWVGQAIGKGHYYTLHTLWFGEACARAGRLEEAIEAAHIALDVATRFKHRAFEAWGHRLLGELMLVSEPQATAEAAPQLLRALAMGEEFGMRPLVARCHADLAGLYHGAGRSEEVTEHARIAAAMFRELGMTHWLGRLESARFEFASAGSV